jgi:hypothetical protein
MTRIILGLVLTAGVGCMGFQPTGPLAKSGSGPAGKAGKAGKAKVADQKDADLPPEPITVPAVKPTPPLNLVDPADVSGDPYEAAQQLMREFEGDQKTIPTAPKTVEISRIDRNGVKQN